MSEKEAKIVQVKVISAKGLLKSDLLNKSDPYVKVKVVKNSLDPEWNEEFLYKIHDDDYEYLLFTIYDHDMLSKDDFLGYVVFPLRYLFKGSKYVDNFDVHGFTDPKMEKKCSGTLKLSINPRAGWEGEKVDDDFINLTKKQIGLMVKHFDKIKNL